MRMRVNILEGEEEVWRTFAAWLMLGESRELSGFSFLFFFFLSFLTLLYIGRGGGGGGVEGVFFW